MNTTEARALLGPPSAKDDPYINARDLFEQALEYEKRDYPGRGTLGTPTERVAAWFTCGVTAAEQGKVGSKIPIEWICLFRQERVMAMTAGVMHHHAIRINSEEA